MANDLIYETLRNRIIAGQYEPGTQLKEEPLGKEFGREAAVPATDGKQ